MAEKHIECKKIHYKSDFKIVERPKDETLGSVPFRYTYFARSAVEASWDGQTFSNCKRNPDGSITIIFNAERLGLGPLKVKREYFIPDSDFEDGICHKVYVENTGIDLVSSASSPVVVEMEVVPPYIYLQEIVDALTDTSPTKALSANQGRVLSARIEEVNKAVNAASTNIEHLKNMDAALDEMITAVMMQMTYAKDIGVFK